MYLGALWFVLVALVLSQSVEKKEKAEKKEKKQKTKKTNNIESTATVEVVILLFGSRI